MAIDGPASHGSRTPGTVPLRRFLSEKFPSESFAVEKSTLNPTFERFSDRIGPFTLRDHFLPEVLGQVESALTDEKFRAMVCRTLDRCSASSFSFCDLSTLSSEQLEKLASGWLNSLDPHDSATDSIFEIIAGARLVSGIKHGDSTAGLAAIIEAGRTPSCVSSLEDPTLAIRYHTIADALADRALYFASGKESADIQIVKSIQQLRLASFESKQCAPSHTFIGRYLKAGAQLSELLEHGSNYYSLEDQNSIFYHCITVYSIAAKKGSDPNPKPKGSFWATHLAANEALKLFEAYSRKFSVAILPEKIIEHAVQFVSSQSSLLFYSDAAKWAQHVKVLLSQIERSEQPLDPSLAPHLAKARMVAITEADQLQRDGDLNSAAERFRDGLQAAIEARSVMPSAEINCFVSHLLPEYILELSIAELKVNHRSHVAFARAALALQTGDFPEARNTFRYAIATVARNLSVLRVNIGTVQACCGLASFANKLLESPGSKEEFTGGGPNGAGQLAVWWEVVDHVRSIAHHFQDSEPWLSLRYRKVEFAVLKKIGDNFDTSDKAALALLNRYLKECNNGTCSRVPPSTPNSE